MARWMVVLYFGISFLFCTSTPYEADKAAYSSDHFKVFFEESVFSIQEVQRICARKERLLTFANNALQLAYTGHITAYLYLWGEEFAYANIREETFESREYVMTDPGHEIVHVVCFEEMGYSRSGFVKEGIATAVELDQDHIDAIEAFVDYSNYHSMLIQTDSGWGFRKPTITEQISSDAFDYEYYSYKQAGAFMRYCVNQFGIDALKEFYKTTVNTPAGTRADDFKAVFKSSPAETEKKFLQTYFPTVKKNSPAD